MRYTARDSIRRSTVMCRFETRALRDFTATIAGLVQGRLSTRCDTVAIRKFDLSIVAQARGAGEQ